MTKKDYEVIAEGMKNGRQANTGNAKALEGWEWTVRALANKLEDENPRFQKDRFMVACGMGTTLRLSNGHTLYDPHNLLAND